MTKEIAKQLNLHILPAGTGKRMELCTIPNSDGTPRWIFPSHISIPLFLKFYHAEGLRSKVVASLFKLLFRLNLIKRIYPASQRWVEMDSSQNSPWPDLTTAEWALFTGTAGPNNKMVLYTKTETESSFYKIPVSNDSKKTLQREYWGVSLARSIQPTSFSIPETSLDENGILKTEEISESHKRSNLFSEKHINMMEELYNKSAFKTSAMESEAFRTSVERIRAAAGMQDDRISRLLLRRVEELGLQLEQEEMVFTQGHGDFTPWNMFESEKKLSVYDWELASDSYPLGFDAFHFIIQKGILIDRKPWKEIRKEIDLLKTGWGEATAEKYGTDWDLCLKFYLFIQVSNHLELYSRQEEWHLQIHWLLHTWSEALSELFSRESSHRGLLIEDLFISLQNKPYAVIKFPETEPAKLDPYSDIDICMQKEDVKELTERLRKHSLVHSVSENRKSFMTTVQIFLKDHGILNLDLIWQLKWKYLEMMPAKTVLLHSRNNAFDIKTMSNSDLASYLGLFYGLNGSAVPENRAQIFYSESAEQDPFGSQILSAHAQDQNPKKELIKLLLMSPANRGIRGLKQRLTYLTDSLKSLFRPSGMVITFSGVDGAGKSTVIEHIRKEFEKKLRRKVVILRHRPSLLPILSAWTKGKVKAEEEAAGTLPRQGMNHSLLSSLLRFSYYYADYIAGQFLVYLRHVLRGEVVLYDRYYFDFINDSVRSNIRLPEPILKAGYAFLLKPHFNFFLYAEADTILARKQELDKETITELTSKYLTLFRSLDSKTRSRGRYVPLLNNRLDHTISTIMNTVTGRRISIENAH